jgi:hypothetical protein
MSKLGWETVSIILQHVYNLMHLTSFLRISKIKFSLHLFLSCMNSTGRSFISLNVSTAVHFMAIRALRGAYKFC